MLVEEELVSLIKEKRVVFGLLGPAKHNQPSEARSEPNPKTTKALIQPNQKVGLFSWLPFVFLFTTK